LRDLCKLVIDSGMGACIVVGMEQNNVIKHGLTQGLTFAQMSAIIKAARDRALAELASGSAHIVNTSKK